MFEEAFSITDKDKNIVHRAFKIINSFCYLDEDKLPKEGFNGIMDKMDSLLREYIDKCDDLKKRTIQDIIDEETDIRVARYNKRYPYFINLLRRFDDFVEQVENQENEVIYNKS